MPPHLLRQTALAQLVFLLHSYLKYNILLGFIQQNRPDCTVFYTFYILLTNTLQFVFIHYVYHTFPTFF